MRKEYVWPQFSFFLNLYSLGLTRFTGCVVSCSSVGGAALQHQITCLVYIAARGRLQKDLKIFARQLLE